jgi:dolichyl-diphosphooligosaccharide--protein glycosyltransferase
MMEESLLYRLHSHLVKPGVTISPDRFKEVYRSQYGKVRIFQVLKVDKVSRAWVADPANRICDAPGSWYCNGQYPPALSKLISRRKNFAQLEDFNTGGGNKEYTKEYMARMSGDKPKSSRGHAKSKREPDFDEADDEPESKPKEQPKKLTPKRRSKKWAEQVPWENSEQTTMMYQLLEKNDLSTLDQWLETSPDAVHMRSEDGRGPLWWANEFGHADAKKLLKKYKVRDDLVDKNGNKP